MTLHISHNVFESDWEALHCKLRNWDCYSG